MIEHKQSILFIDPAWSGPTGWLKLHSDGSLWPGDWGTLKSKEAKDWARRFELLQGIKTLVIENTYLKYIKAYAALERAKMLWTQAAIDHFGLTKKDIIEVPPQTWQSKCQRGWRPGMDKDQAAIEFYIRHRWFDGHGPELTDHEISCFGLLSYYLDHIYKRRDLNKKTNY